MNHILLPYKLFILLAILTIGACQSKSTQKTEAVVKEKETKQPVALSDFSNSPLFDDARLSNMTYTDGKFSFDVSGDSYKLGAQTSDAENKMCANSGKGQHIHLIVDKAPYAAKYTSEFDHTVEDGQHYILAFLSRSYHESIKSPGAAISEYVQIQNGNIVRRKENKESMVFYSRPKGTYVGKDAENVMLDYYLTNPVQGQYVVADVNGKKMDLKQWKPYTLTGLPMGENTITLTLVDAEGNMVETANNPVSRTFTLKSDPEDSM